MHFRVNKFQVFASEKTLLKRAWELNSIERRNSTKREKARAECKIISISHFSFLLWTHAQEAEHLRFSMKRALLTENTWVIGESVCDGVACCHAFGIHCHEQKLCVYSAGVCLMSGRLRPSALPHARPLPRHSQGRFSGISQELT